MRHRIAIALAAVLFAAVFSVEAVALTGSDVTNLKTVRRKAQSIQAVLPSLSPDVPGASKTVIREAAQDIIDEVNALLTPSPTPTTPPPTTPPPTGEVTVTAAGDIGGSGAGKTGDLVRALNPDLALTLGDAAQHDGTLSDYATYYDPFWGSFKSKTFSTVGNHDYHVANAAGYTTYFNTTTMAHEKFIGDWLIVSVDSVQDIDANMNLLMSILETDDHQCELVIWHRPRWSSGLHGSATGVQPLWNAAAQSAGKADVVLSGHDHVYERFAPKNASGQVVSSGTRQFVVGMGGAGTYSFGTPEVGSEKRITGDANQGVLELTLKPTSYDWRYVRATDGATLDSGTTACA